MAIFFDLDDTLLDHSTAAKIGITSVYENYRSDFHGNLEDFLARWDKVSERYFQSNELFHQYSFQEQCRLRVKETFSMDLSDKEADQRFDVYLKSYEAGWKLYSDTIPCLNSLMGHKLGLITNGGREMHRSKIEKFKLGDYFPIVVISREVGHAKPEKVIFELAAKEAGVPLKDCFYIGDRLQTDALGGQKAGMRGIWLDRKGLWQGEDLGVSVIASLVELPGLLKN